MPSLTISDLAAGLEKFGNRYTALDVFAHDVSGLEQLLAGEAVPELQEVEPIGPAAVSFSLDGKQYRLTVFQDHDVVRVTRDGGVRTETMAGAAFGTAVGGALGAAAALRPQSREIAALAGMALGLLIGGVIGAAVADATPARRIFALRFDGEKKQWRAYDGGLIRWMKERLAAPDLG